MAAVPALTVAVACVPLFKDHAKPCGWALKRPSLQQAFEGAWPGPESVTRGVRFGPLSDRGSTDVSIHAPAWGATVFASKMIVRPMFRSALPRGERPSADNIFGGREKELPGHERSQTRQPLARKPRVDILLYDFRQLPLARTGRAQAARLRFAHQVGPS